MFSVIWVKLTRGFSTCGLIVVKHKKYAFSILLCILISPASYSADKPTITWGKYDFAPVYITQGTDKGKGIVDLQIPMLKQQLPNYQHIDINSNVPRIIRRMREGEGTFCSSVLKTPDREKEVVFSIPTLLVPSHEIITTAAIAEKIEQRLGRNIATGISLVELLGYHPEFKLGVGFERSYGSTFNKIIDRYRDKVWFKQEDAKNLSLLNMLFKKRIDYFLEYSWQVQYQLSQQRSAVKIVSIKIIEDASSLFAYIACSNNDAGQMAIHNINEALLTLRHQIKYRATMENWLPQSSITAYRKRYQGFLDMVE